MNKSMEITSNDLSVAGNALQFIKWSVNTYVSLDYRGVMAGGGVGGATTPPADENEGRQREFPPA